MIRTRRAGLFIAAIMAMLCGQSLAQTQPLLRCGPFTQAVDLGIFAAWIYFYHLRAERDNGARVRKSP